MTERDSQWNSIAVVIPAFRVSAHILGVLQRVSPKVSWIFLVDDACPEGTGALVESKVCDPRVKVIYHATNQGVGGAVMTGYRAAISAGAEVIVKIDGDGQMDPSLIDTFVGPILSGEADYSKGNRLFDIETPKSMPLPRLFGNIMMSFLTKASSGYWNLADPTNGYTAISARVAGKLPPGKVDNGFFFESDLLFRLYLMRAVVVDVPMEAAYGSEISNLSIMKEWKRFLFGNVRNFLKRIFYTYIVRDFSFASLELCLGTLMFAFGTVFGAIAWFEHIRIGAYASSGTVMLAALPIILGFQMLIGFFSHDMSQIPARPIQRRLRWDARKRVQTLESRSVPSLERKYEERFFL